MTHSTAIRRDPTGDRPLLLDAALTFAGRGWPIFPLRPGSKAPALHRQERCPLTGVCGDGHVKWEQRATTDQTAIARCWSHKPYNIGLATGPAGLIVVDLDMPKANSGQDAPDGAHNLLALCERAGQAVPATLTVRTPSGGTHLYFTAPDGIRLGNTAGKLAPLIDTRAHGGYVVAPGSTTAAGTYEITDDSPVAELPAWLLALLRPPAPRPLCLRMPGAVRGGSAARAALGAECDVVRQAPAKQANNTLNRSAFKVGSRAAVADIGRPTCLPLLSAH
ncbi:bifunctional DNA primase/polymerase [Streptomyces avidinii]